MRTSRWIFVRAYLLVVFAIVAGGWGLDRLMESQFQRAQEQQSQEQWLGAFLYVEQQLELVDSTHTALNLASQAMGFPITLIQLSDFDTLGSDASKLAAGQTLTLYDSQDNPIYYRRAGQTEQAIAIGPVAKTYNSMGHWLVPLFLLLIAGGVYLWIRPLYRDLHNLQHAARAFGKQDFTTRVTIPAGSWLAPLGSSFNSLAERIQWLLLSHKELNHAVSHELRTPLARLRFGLEMLEVGESETNRRQLENINGDIDELNNLIEEMLNYAQLTDDNLQPRLESVEIDRWLTEYFETSRQTQEVPWTYTANTAYQSEIIAIDTRLMKRALDNLVSNACRYADSIVELKFSVEKNNVEIMVADDGPGIPADKRDAVLTAYTRLPATSGKVSHGFGLGLAIVKRISELHGGEVIIRDSDYGGAAIGLVLPR